MLPTAFVFYWMVTLSLKPQLEAAAYPPLFFRFSLTLAGYRAVFTKYPFLLYTWNSFVVALGSTALGLVVGLPAAYSIARWRQQGLALAVLVARIIPGISYLIPWYIFFRTLRMVDTFGALILTHLIVGLPIIIWVMIGFFEDVPADLEDAALIDGCSYFAAFWRIAPLYGKLCPRAVMALHRPKRFSSSAKPRSGFAPSWMATSRIVGKVSSSSLAS